MQIDIAEQNGAALVRPAAARIDVEVAGELRAALVELIDAGHQSLVVDMSDVTFLDSSGLGALVSALKAVKLRSRDGDIRLANVQPPVVALLEIIRLHRVFSSFPTVEQAVQSFPLHLH